MSYGPAAALQEAVYQRLAGDPALDALVSGAIYDAAPSGPLPDLYVTLGPEEARARSDGSGSGAWHRFTVSVIGRRAGFRGVKLAAAAISDTLSDAPLILTRGACPAIHFFRARARRDGTGEMRRIDLTFRARVDDTQNP